VANELKPVSILNKIGSVLYLLIGAVWLWVFVLAVTALILASGRLDETFWVLTLVFVVPGIGATWRGAAIWVRWKLPLGIILTLLGLLTITRSVGMLAPIPPNANSTMEWDHAVGIAWVVVAVLLLFGGVALILVTRASDRSQDRLARSSPPVTHGSPTSSEV